VQQLSQYRQIKTAYWVQKSVKYLPQKPFYVLGIIRDRSFFEVNQEQDEHKLVQRIADEVKFPGYAYIIILNSNTQKLAKKLHRVEGAVIYQK
jgi:hypothetical protein